MPRRSALFLAAVLSARISCAVAETSDDTPLSASVAQEPDDAWFDSVHAASDLYSAAELARLGGNASRALELYESAGALGAGPGSADALAALARMHEFGWGWGAVAGSATAQNLPGPRRSLDVYVATFRGGVASGGAAASLGVWAADLQALAAAALEPLGAAVDAALAAFGFTDSATAWYAALALAPPSASRAGEVGPEPALVPQVCEWGQRRRALPRLPTPTLDPTTRRTWRGRWSCTGRPQLSATRLRR